MTAKSLKNGGSRSAEAGYETSDVRSGWVVKLIALIGACLFVSLPVVVVFVQMVEPRPQNRPESPVPLQGPRLQIDPAQDRKALEAEAQGRLSAYRLLPETDGAYARIPIARAIEILAERGWREGEIMPAEEKLQ